MRARAGSCTGAGAVLLAPLVLAASLGSGPAQQAGAAGVVGPPPLGLDLYVPIPEENPPTLAKVSLGRRLFFDPILSIDRTVSCASCHRPADAFSDTRPVSAGVLGRRTARNTPSLLNAAWRRSFFWDGRMLTLEDQVLAPIVNPDEMGASLDDVIRRLAREDDYRSAFERALGGGPDAGRLAQALASYVRTLRAGDSPVDRYRAGDAAALAVDAVAGFRLFTGKAHCAQCHFGPLFTDDRFHNTGVGWGGPDTGRHLVTGDDHDRGRFRTPSLRNVATTPPYMHDGSLATLEDVIELYDRGGVANPFLDPEIRPLRLSGAEKRQLLAFLLALTSADIEAPARHRH